MPRIKGAEVFRYDDYRQFLRDALADASDRRDLSMRKLARVAGFGSHTFLVYLADGRRNLGPDTARKLAAALGLEQSAADYFVTLVSYNQAATPAEKERWFTELNRVRRHSTFYKLNHQHYEYFDKWYYPVIRELAVMSNWGDDYRLLGSRVRPAIGAREAKKAVKALIDMRMIERLPGGAYRQTAAAVTTDNIPSHLIRTARNNYINLALEASDTLEKSERNISFATVALTQEQFQTASALIDELRERIVSMAAAQTAPEQVYQLNFQLFPLSTFEANPHAGETPPGEEPCV